MGGHWIRQVSRKRKTSRSFVDGKPFHFKSFGWSTSLHQCCQIMVEHAKGGEGLSQAFLCKEDSRSSGAPCLSPFWTTSDEKCLETRKTRHVLFLKQPERSKYLNLNWGLADNSSKWSNFCWKTGSKLNGSCSKVFFCFFEISSDIFWMNTDSELYDSCSKVFWDFLRIFWMNTDSKLNGSCSEVFF